MTDAKKISIIISEYFKSKGQLLDFTLPSHRILYKRHLREAKEILECAGGDLEEAVSRIHRLAKWARSNGLSYSISTVTKRWLEDNTPTQKPYIIDNGKRYEARQKEGRWEILDGGRWYKYSGRQSDIKYD
jgi:hypothetical protein